MHAATYIYNCTSIYVCLAFMSLCLVLLAAKLTPLFFFIFCCVMLSFLSCAGLVFASCVVKSVTCNRLCDDDGLFLCNENLI